MPACKVCGEWFAKTNPHEELCFKCECALSRLSSYATRVVRCKDCKHYRNYQNGLCYLHTEPKTNARGYSGDAVCVEPDDFCSYGEKKDGGDAEGLHDPGAVYDAAERVPRLRRQR